MKNMLGVLVTVAMLCTTAGNAAAMAKEGCGGDCAGCHTLTQQEANALLKGLNIGTVKRVSEPAVKGLWEVDFEKDGKSAVAYVDYGKKHIIPGQIFTIASRQPINPAAEQKPAPQKPKKVKVSEIPLKNSIILGDPLAKRRLFVFTDPDCPFCAKLHDELKKLVEMEKVAVFIKFMPLKMHPNAYDRARVILQGPDSARMLDDAFSGRPLPPATANTPSKGVDDSMALAARLGINATPTMAFPDGTVHAGSLPAAEIQKMLTKGGKKKK